MIDRVEITATQEDLQGADDRTSRFATLAAGLAFGACIWLSIPAVIIANSVATGALRYLLIPLFLAALQAPIGFWLHRTNLKNLVATHDLMAELQGELRAAVDEARTEADNHAAQVQRQVFETQLANALEMAEGELEVLDVVERAFASTLPDFARRAAPRRQQSRASLPDGLVVSDGRAARLRRELPRSVPRGKAGPGATVP